MSNNLVIKNDSFIQSMHNNIQCIESLDPNDKGTSRQYWFTASMLANIFDITDKTVRNNIEFLMRWGEVQSGKNLLDWKMSYENSNLTRDVTLYDLQVFNKLAMQLRTDAAMEIRNKFSDILVQVETTGQYNVQPVVPQTYLEALKALVASEEEKEQLKLTNENLTTELTEVSKQRDKAIRERGYINDKRTATLMSQEGIRARKINKLENELSDTIEKLDQANIDNDILKTQLEIAKSSMLTNRRVCEMLRDRFEISWADSTLKSRTSKALQSIANEFGENIIYDKQFVDGVLRKVPYYTQRTADILMQRLEYDCAYLKQF